MAKCVCKLYFHGFFKLCLFVFRSSQSHNAIFGVVIIFEGFPHSTKIKPQIETSHAQPDLDTRWSLHYAMIDCTPGLRP